MAKRRGVSLSVGRGEKSKKGGLTAKGRAKYNRATGSNLQAPVTEKNPTGKRAARRKNSTIYSSHVSCIVFSWL